MFKPFHISSIKRAEINNINSDDVLLALISKYNSQVTINPNNRKEAFVEFFKEQLNPIEKLSLSKRMKLYSLFVEKVFPLLDKRVPIWKIVSEHKERDKYLVYLWLEGVL